VIDNKAHTQSSYTKLIHKAHTQFFSIIANNNLAISKYNENTKQNKIFVENKKVRSLFQEISNKMLICFHVYGMFHSTAVSTESPSI